MHAFYRVPLYIEFTCKTKIESHEIKLLKIDKRKYIFMHRPLRISFRFLKVKIITRIKFIQNIDPSGFTFYQPAIK